MTTEYNPWDIEAHWRARWAEEHTYRTHTPAEGQRTYYCLDFFPYPSGAGLSVGHGRNYVPSDVIARYRRMRGDAVLHPMGWDAFGLPAENEAIKTGAHPADSTARYAANYKRQLDLLGCSYDWEREINSSDPAYYRWNQHFFLLLYQRGLAYRAAAPVHWCESCQTVLAAEEIEDGDCWRCHNPVVQRTRPQWYIRVTAYADELYADLDRLDWPEHILAMQRNWIGRSAEGDAYHLRDWLISRQRYWGTPIPIIHCPACGEVPVPEADLPVTLPPLPDFRPRGDGKAPLANVPEFVNTTCPRCGGPAERETDTMTGFVCSSWYYLRFTDPHNAAQPFAPAEAARWLPVDVYVGGAEHAIGHLLYSRFWTKALADAGLVDFREPFPVLRSQGVLHARDPQTGKVERMSKSKGNIVTPESVIERYGADVTRLHLLFMGPFEANVVWETEADGVTPQHIEGARRFLQRVWRIANSEWQMANGEWRMANGEWRMANDEWEKAENVTLRRAMHRTIREVTEQTEALHFNKAISALMTFSGEVESYQRQFGATAAGFAACATLVTLLAPFAPFVTEEIWRGWGNAESVHIQPWPVWDADLAQIEEVEMAVQVNGKVRDRIRIPADADEAAIRQSALAAPGVQRALAQRAARHIIIVPGRVVNIVA